VADIGNIHDVLDPIAIVQQDPFENVFENIGAQIADVGIIVNRRPAGVQSGRFVLNRDKFFFASAERIV
jgi:hypothetical protein